MKRFLADAALILILVAIGSYVKNLDTSQNTHTIQQKVDGFEDSIAQNHEVGAQIKASGLNEIKENKASALAKSGSDLVINGIQASVALFSDIFDSIFQ